MRLGLRMCPTCLTNFPFGAARPSEEIVPLQRMIRRRRVEWKYRNEDPDVCCCGCMMGQGGSICHHGGCRSMKEYCITSEMGESQNEKLSDSAPSSGATEPKL